MKTIDLDTAKLDLDSVIDMARQEPLLPLTADGQEFFVTLADDFEKEAESLGRGQSFQYFLDGRARIVVGRFPSSGNPRLVIKSTIRGPLPGAPPRDDDGSQPGAEQDQELETPFPGPHPFPRCVGDDDDGRDIDEPDERSSNREQDQGPDPHHIDDRADTTRNVGIRARWATQDAPGDEPGAVQRCEDDEGVDGRHQHRGPEPAPIPASRIGREITAATRIMTTTATAPITPNAANSPARTAMASMICQS